MANAITAGRILLSLILLFCPTISPPFCAVYLLAGLSDVLDGYIARRTGSGSELGAKLDTAADFVLVCVCLFKFLPILSVPGWVTVWIAVIALIKVSSGISGYLAGNRFAAVHSFLNKATGLMLFLLPFTIGWIDLKYSAAFICVIATLAAIQERRLIRAGKDADAHDAGANLAMRRRNMTD